jgi:hypothetical protein
MRNWQTLRKDEADSKKHRGRGCKQAHLAIVLMKLSGGNQTQMAAASSMCHLTLGQRSIWECPCISAPPLDGRHRNHRGQVGPCTSGPLGLPHVAMAASQGVRRGLLLLHNRKIWVTECYLSRSKSAPHLQLPLNLNLFPSADDTAAIPTKKHFRRTRTSPAVLCFTTIEINQDPDQPSTLQH